MVLKNSKQATIDLVSAKGRTLGAGKTGNKNEDGSTSFHGVTAVPVGNNAPHNGDLSTDSPLPIVMQVARGGAVQDHRLVAAPCRSPAGAYERIRCSSNNCSFY